MEFQIVCVVKNQHGIITSVGTNDGHRYPVNTIISLMNEHNFFIDRNGHKTSVYGRQSPNKTRSFLTTDPAIIEENNLDFLPECPPIS